MCACMLSRFSCVRPCETPWTAAHQATLSTGFSRQEYWSGLPFPSPIGKWSAAAAAAAKSLQSCPTLCDPIDGSPPGSPVPGIFQARVLEWGVIAFSEESGLIFTKGPWQSWSRNLEWYSINRLVHVCWIYKVYLGTPCH